MKQTQTHSKKKTIKTYLSVYGPALVIAIIGFIFAFQYVGPPPPQQITIATGSEQGAYYHFGLKYARWLRRHKIKLKVIQTSGSVENLRLLEDATSGVKLALIQGGTGTGQTSLLSLGSLNYEPLWVFHRKDVPIHFLSDLDNRRVALGASFSGTRAIASLLAEENGIDPNTYATVNLSSTEAADALKSGKIDAAFFVASPTAPLIKTLLADSNLALMSMVRAEAYTRRNPFLSHVTIPEGMIDLRRNIPSETVHLISPTTNLVIREDLHPALVDLVLHAAVAVHGSGGMFERAGEFPSPTLLEFPLSPEAARYYKHGAPFLQRFLPFWIATLVGRLKVLLLPLIVLLLPLFKIVPPTFRWRERRKILCWYRQVQALDLSLEKMEKGSSLGKLYQDIENIERKVTRLRVPLTYTDQLYNLRVHIRLVREKVEKEMLERHKETSTDES
jgi:TRAP transporter TAXI family solute receptor